jgi:hypothetical protein
MAGCDDGFVCISKSCEAISKIGEGCAVGGEVACGDRASCVLDHDGQPRCRARAMEGAPCRADESLGDDADRPRCDVDAGFGCVKGACSKVEWHAIGTKCSDFDDARRCLGGACEDGVCAPLPIEGAACLDGWTCLPPANCLSGRCALPNAKTCGLE